MCAVLIDSPLPPTVVLENLRARGREWRESTVPDDLRKLDIIDLKVETKGAEFEMRWGRSFVVYNPICFGSSSLTGMAVASESDSS